MKDRVREALFNLLGPAVRGKHALDLFAGTGALGLEAISRGAARTTLVERRAAAAERIRRNLKEIGVQEPCQVIPADAFSWFPAFCSAAPAGGEPWVVFLSPPYDYYSQREADMLALIARAVGCSPRGSMVVVECDERFDLSRLPQAGRWDVRQYPPTVLAIWRNEGVEPVPRQ
jgi:16S rRNA (guanine966-N2)-methyltransferase